MFRFTIRDLCWAMFVVGFSLWTLNYRRQILAVQRTYLKRTTEEIARREQADQELAQTKKDAAEVAERMSRVVKDLQIEVEHLRAAKDNWYQGSP